MSPIGQVATALFLSQLRHGTPKKKVKPKKASDRDNRLQAGPKMVSKYD
jgi:hypothetical protein